MNQNSPMIKDYKGEALESKLLMMTLTVSICKLFFAAVLTVGPDDGLFENSVLSAPQLASKLLNTFD